MTTQTRKIEVFRPGTFQPMQGGPISYTADDLRALAANYDAAQAPVPVVVGHPKTDAPAYGWAKSFSYDDNTERLYADIGDIEPAFADAVSAGRYKKISLSLFSPASPHNPKPGQWYAKHIGFLGAAAPAVPGLKPVSFAADDPTVLTLEFADATALRDVAGLFRSLREWMIDKFDLDAADKALPGWPIGWIEEAAERDPPQASPSYAAPQPQPPQEPETSMDARQLAADRAALAECQKKLNERERAAAHGEHVSFAERLVGENRLLPALKDKVVAVLDGLAVQEGPALEVSFAEGAQTITQPVAALLKDILAAQPAVVSFGAVKLGDDAPAVEFAVPSGMTTDPASAELHAKAIAFQSTLPGTDYMAAMAAVNR